MISIKVEPRTKKSCIEIYHYRRGDVSATLEIGWRWGSVWINLGEDELLPAQDDILEIAEFEDFEAPPISPPPPESSGEPSKWSGIKSKLGDGLSSSVKNAKNKLGDLGQKGGRAFKQRISDVKASNQIDWKN